MLKTNPVQGQEVRERRRSTRRRSTQGGKESILRVNKGREESTSTDHAQESTKKERRKSTRREGIGTGLRADDDE